MTGHVQVLRRHLCSTNSCNDGVFDRAGCRWTRAVPGHVAGEFGLLDAPRG